MNDLVLANQPIMEVQSALAMRQSLMDYIDGMLTSGVDYGSVPGTNKNVLLKPGAEKLAAFLGLTPDYIEIGTVEDWIGQDHAGEAFFSYRYKCNLYKGAHKVGQGIGSCNSWEKKYRWRWMNEAELPPHLNPDILQSRQSAVSEFEFAINKAETTGQYGKPQEYWNEFEASIKVGEATKSTKKTQSGKELPIWVITTTMYRVPNEAIYDQVNTIDKMSQKRALVAAILVAASVSELFTQDLEDLSYGDPEPVIINTSLARTETEKPQSPPPPPPSPEPQRHWSEIEENRQKVTDILDGKEVGIAHLFIACSSTGWNDMHKFQGTGAEAVAKTLEYVSETESLIENKNLSEAEAN